MMDIQLFPRYLSHQLRTQLNATVVGRLIQINKKKSSVILETDPEAKMILEVVLPESQNISSFSPDKFYEVRGICKNGKEMQLKGFTCYGADFDLSSYNEMLQLATKEFKSIFYP